MAESGDKKGSRQTGSLELDEHLPLQRIGWLVDRVAWAALLLVIVAGLFGLFGQGGLSSQRAQSPDGRLAVEYERFARRGGDNVLRLEITGQSGADSLSLWLDRQYVEAMKVDGISPEPQEQVVAVDRYVYSWSHEPDVTLRVTFDFTVSDIGGLTGAAGLEGSDVVVGFDQFLYP